MAPRGSKPTLPAMLVIGILCGLAAALLQATGYLCTRHFLHPPGRTGLQLLALSEIWLGAASLPLLAILWQPLVGDASTIAIALGLGVGGYLLAQLAFFWTVSTIPASRIAPLLGLKIAVVAVIAHTIGMEQLTLLHWSAVALTLVAAVGIQYAGDPLPTRALVGVLLTATCFGVSDIGIRKTQMLFPEAGPFDASLLTVGLTYACCLPVGILLLPFCGGFREQPWRASLPYSAIWFVAMGALFSAFALAGVVLGVILQAMRGPFSLLLAVVVARLGMVHIEVPQARSAWWRQMAAALLMVVAIALYVWA